MNSLNLSDFVSDTIVEIAKGVENAKTELNGMNVLINPATDSKGLVYTNSNNNIRAVQNIEFDLSVAVNQEEKQIDENENSTGAKIQVVSLINFSMGGSFSSKNAEESINTNSVINRIKFTIPVSFSTNAEGTKIKSGTKARSIH